MADSLEKPDDEAANQVARATFLWTLITAAAFVGVVFVFILR